MTKRPPKKKPRAVDPTGVTIVLILLLVAGGLYFSGIWNGPEKHGKLNCTPAEIAANVACR